LPRLQGKGGKNLERVREYRDLIKAVERDKAEEAPDVKEVEK
jgi:hypothetical protein